MISSIWSRADGFSIFAMSPARSPIERARLDHVAWLLDEGEGDPVHSELEPESKVGPILLGQRREIENRAGKVDALAIGDHAAHDDLGVDEIARRDLSPGPAPGRRRSGDGPWARPLRRSPGGAGGSPILSPSPPFSTNRIASPASTLIEPPLIVPTRILGPWRSSRMPMGRLSSPSSVRMAAWTRA